MIGAFWAIVLSLKAKCIRHRIQLWLHPLPTFFGFKTAVLCVPFPPSSSFLPYLPPKHTQSTAHLLPPNALISKHSDNHPFCDNTGRLGCWLLLCCCRRSFGPQSGSAAMISFVRAPVSFCPPAKVSIFFFWARENFFGFFPSFFPCFALLSLFFEIGCLFLSPQHGLPPKSRTLWRA